MECMVKLLRPAASSGTAKRLKQVLGAGAKTSIDQYADELRVQTIHTARSSRSSLTRRPRC